MSLVTILSSLLWGAPKATIKPTLASLPEDIIRLIAHIFVSSEPKRGWKVWGEEQNAYRSLFPLSETCKRLRETLKPLLFGKIYNWNIDGERVWPGGLWPHAVEVNLRDHVVGDPRCLQVTDDVYAALSHMPLLTTMILRYNASVPLDALRCVGALSGLTSLEIHQARLDGPMPSSLHFPSLQRLLVSISGFRGIVRAEDIDRVAEQAHVGRLLRCASASLSFLHVSGDLLPDDFVDIRWPRLRTLIVSEHTPATYLLVPAFTTRMPQLRTLELLYAADMGRASDELYPPFVYGDTVGKPLVHTLPFLCSLALSNLAADDPIFSQLPLSLTALHVHARRDPYYGEPRDFWDRGETAFSNAEAMSVVDGISYLPDLEELTIVLREFPTAELLKVIASRFPRLTFLEASHATYRLPREGQYDELWDARDPAKLAALAGLKHLQRLRLSLDLLRNRVETHVNYIQVVQWIFDGIPSLEEMQLTFLNHGVWLPWWDPNVIPWIVYDRKSAADLVFRLSHPIMVVRT
ncbi:unnamed protein product [Mycena citricolor]|uniref:F-box domain-containing protein n=1 Tax=Mycena citricolor TaxID=2018698 RepID=A0AAD2HBW1_9AGAR|nr:unnamed protein product [Mycena citricolor]